MGQGQSTGEGAQAQEQMKADYYDLLGVERDASEDDIKKAYRRKALELHPDRNYGNVDNATTLFAEIQSAYEVLSDPQERAWYDSHRDILLRGDQGGNASTEEFSYNIRMTQAEEVMKLTMKFNGRLDYSDSTDGFYGGLNDFFKQLAKEEDTACRWDNLDPIEYPEFGHKDDNYEDVVRPFYAAWNGFSTKKSYSWKDEYRLADAPDRRIRRLMEKENKKLREEGIQEFNDAVRTLIAFVKKRDPRFQENQKSEAERQKMLRNATAAQAAKARASRQAELEAMAAASMPEWVKSREVDVHEGGFSSDSEEEEHEYECVVCDKIFKSEAQFHAHEKSKKHLKLLKQMKRELKVEDEVLGLERNSDTVDETEDGQVTAQDEAPAHPPEPTASSKLNGNDVNQAHPDGIEPGKPLVEPNREPEVSAEDDDYAPRSTVADRLANENLDNLPSRLKATVLEDTPTTSDTDGPNMPKMGKAAQKRAKKAAKAPGQDNSVDGDFRCAVCQAAFPSKTRLFKHIKDEDHAALASQTKTGAKGKGKKR